MLEIGNPQLREHRVHFHQHFSRGMGEHFGGCLFLTRCIGIARGDNVGFGHGQRNAIGDRIVARINHRHSALALTACCTAADGSGAFAGGDCLRARAFAT